MNRPFPGGSTAHLLAQSCKLLRTRVHARLEHVGLYRGQQFVLCALWDDEGLSHSELAEKILVRPATTTNLLNRMEKAGLVERRPDPDDQRVSRVYLTDAARRMRDTVEAAWQQIDEQVFAGFSAEERISFEQFLLRIQDNLMPRTDCRSEA
jgi:DNA-binding MarR family transcriptional regulator